MKVYSHYYRTEGEVGLRWRSLMQFGDSWNIIGSVVMKNPGSAVPIRLETNKDIIAELVRFETSDDPWYEFTVDNTMQKVALLFASYYGKEFVNELNGVVQIFNLFYIMDPDEKSAEVKLKQAGLPGDFKSTADLLDYDIAHLFPPVYLGFGDLAFRDEFRDRSRRYFDTLFRMGYPTDYLRENYDDNRFYHPQSLCGTGKNYPESIFIRNRFKAIPTPNDSCAPLSLWKMSKEERLKVVRGVVDNYTKLGLETYKYNPKDSKTIRLLLPLDLQITVTAVGNGYVAVRHIDSLRLHDYNAESFPHKEPLEDLLFTRLGFYRDNANKVWLGVKELESFGNSTNLLAFIGELSEVLKGVAG